MKGKLLYLISWFGIIIFISCTEKEQVMLDLKGSFSGTITTKDEFGYHVTPDQKNCLVTLIGTDSLNQFTDSTGFYSFDTISGGYYTIQISKTGYQTEKEQNISYVTGGVQGVYNYTLRKNFSIKLLNFSVDRDTISQIKIHFNVENANEISTGLLFISQDSTVSNFNFEDIGYFDVIDYDSLLTSAVILIDTIKFSRGSRIFITAAGTDKSTYTEYDIQTDTYIYPHVGELTETYSIFVP